MDRESFGILLSALALMTGALDEPTRAASGSSHDGAQTPDPPQQHSREILARLDEPHTARGWIARHVAIDFESGFQLSGAASYGNHDFDIRLRGPVYGTPLREWNYGLILELEF